MELLSHFMQISAQTNNKEKRESTSLFYSGHLHRNSLMVLPISNLFHQVPKRTQLAKLSYIKFNT